MKQKDIFEDQLKALFSDYEVPVPEDGWTKLEQALDGARRVKYIRRNWYIGSAAAIAVILITGILFFNTPEHIHNPADQILTESKDSNELSDTYEKNILESEENTNIDPAAASDMKKKTTSAHSTKHQETVAAVTTKINETTDLIKNDKLLVSNRLTDIDRDELIIPDAASESSETKHRQSETLLSQEEIDRLILEFANAGNTNIFDDETENSGTSQPVMLALSGRGGLSGSQTVANKPMTLRSAAAAPVADNVEDDFLGSFAKSPIFNADNPTFLTNANNIADNIAEMDHAQPVSVGITVSKNILDTRLSVETGLIYTYLHSKAKNSSINYSSKETQDFHYLGIPLNFNYNFASIGHLDLFSSIGAMIEKDIYGEYRISGQSDHKNLEGTSEGALVEKIKQENFQYSVSAGFGASYPIYDKLHLYAKFGGSYYFDAKNHQYKTIYSDRKIMLDLNAGIRFDF